MVRTICQQNYCIYTIYFIKKKRMSELIFKRNQIPDTTEMKEKS